MEIQIQEEDVARFWEDQAFRDMCSGCKHVNAVLFAKGKHIFLTPGSVIFEHWDIDLDDDYAEILAMAVDIMPRVD